MAGGIFQESPHYTRQTCRRQGLAGRARGRAVNADKTGIISTHLADWTCRKTGVTLG